jgi:hypothetical protein
VKGCPRADPGSNERGGYPGDRDDHAFILEVEGENLFDEEHSPRRSEKLQRALGDSIVGWTPALLDRRSPSWPP